MHTAIFVSHGNVETHLVKRNMCALLSSKIIQDTTHQVLSKSTEFYRRCAKNIWAYLHMPTDLNKSC